MPSLSLSSGYLPKTLSPQFLLLSMTLYGMEYPFGRFGSAIQIVSPPNFLPTPSLLAGKEKEKALTLCKHSSATAKTPGCYQ